MIEAEREFVCDLCGAPAEYELLDRIDGSDLYQVEHRYCGACVVRLSEEDQE